MRTVSTDAERNALVPQTSGELISQSGVLYIAIGMTAGAWQIQSDVPLGKTIVTAITALSTNNQIPTAKAVWDLINP